MSQNSNSIDANLDEALVLVRAMERVVARLTHQTADLVPSLGPAQCRRLSLADGLDNACVSHYQWLAEQDVPLPGWRLPLEAFQTTRLAAMNSTVYCLEGYAQTMAETLGVLKRRRAETVELERQATD